MFYSVESVFMRADRDQATVHRNRSVRLLTACQMRKDACTTKQILYQHANSPRYALRGACTAFLQAIVVFPNSLDGAYWVFGAVIMG